MRSFRILSALAGALLLSLSATAVAAFENPLRSVIEASDVKEYEDFHRLLHPLEHEALPKKDFPLIRSKAEELTRLGEAIVALGVPQGAAEKQIEEFQKELKKFSEALARFTADAREGDDDQLKLSFGAVHDSFEMLAGMQPQKASAK